MERCATCRHWEPLPRGSLLYTTFPDWRLCMRTVPEEAEPYLGTVRPQQGSLSVATGVDETALGLLTAPDFGCIQWEAKADA